VSSTSAEHDAAPSGISSLPLNICLFDTAKPNGPAMGTPECPTWSSFSDILRARREGLKDGRGFVPATFTPEPDGRVRRLKANVLNRTAIALDCETNESTGEVPPPMAEMVERIEATGWAAVIYTSHRHAAEAPRYRIVFPISNEIPPNLPAVELIAHALNVTGVLDTSKVGPASLFYLPSAEPGHLADHQTVVFVGRPIDAVWLHKRAGAMLAAREAEQERQREEALEAAVRRGAERMRQGFDPNDSIIEKVRVHLDLTSELLGHGYKQVGDRFLFPGSGTGVPGVHILRGSDGVERVYSHHAADPLAPGNLPSWCRTKAIDVVDVVAILDHGSDLTAALRTLAKRFGLETPRAGGIPVAPPYPVYDGPDAPADTTLSFSDVSEDLPSDEPRHANRLRQQAVDGADFVWPTPLDFLADPNSDAPELRHEHIPAAINDFVFDTAARMGVDPACVAIGCIVSCASVVSDDWKVQPKRFDYLWTESPRLWGVIVGDPSILKSPVISACTHPIDKLAAAARKRHAASMRDYDLAIRSYTKAEKAGKADEVEKPRHPKLERYLIESSTVEAISEVLRDDDASHQRAPAGKVLSRHDEMSEFFANLDRYQGGGKGGGDRGAYLRLYNGGPYSVDRIGRGSFSVPNWSACFLGGMQPGPIQKIAQNAVEDGLLQRFMFVVPGPQELGMDRAPSKQAQHRYNALIPALTALHPARSSNGEDSEVVVLHTGAHQHRENVDAVARAMALLPDTSPRLQSAFGKYPGLFARTALTFHLIEIADAHANGLAGPPMQVISVETASRAASFILDIALSHLLRADALMFSTTQSGHARWIAEYILAQGLQKITSREVVRAYRALKAPEDKNELAAVMASLVVVGWLEPEIPPHTSKPINTWTVNPAVHEMFSPRAERERTRRAKSRADVALHVEKIRLKRLNQDEVDSD
jgi:hypothetical protein